MLKTKKDKKSEQRRKEFWNIIKSNSPRLRRALQITDQIEVRLLATCASALVSIAMRNEKSKKKRAPSAWALFAGEKMKEGKSIKEAAEMWKQKNENPNLKS